MFDYKTPDKQHDDYEGKNGEVEENEFLNFFENEPEKQPIPEFQSDETEEAAESEFNEEKVISTANKATAKAGTEAFSLLAAYLIGITIAKSQNYKKYTIPKSVQNELTQIIVRMMPADGGGVLPNWLQLTIILGTAYTPLISGAIADREENERTKRLKQKEFEAKEKRIEKEFEDLENLRSEE